MTGPEHWREAEQLLDAACDYGCPHTGCAHELAYLAHAQVHATLAVAAAVAAGARMQHADRAQWQAVADGAP
jgi:hypothetical protein